MKDDSPPPNHFPDGTAWYVLRTKNKCEHIAAAHLRLLENVETFCPRIRYHKATQRGKVLYSQAMFPSYLFAKFHYEEQSRAVVHAHGVTKVVRFGNECPAIAPTYIDFLKTEMGPEEIKTLKPRMEPGDEVEIANGPFRGLKAIVQFYHPAKERIGILMEIMGHQQRTTVSTADLVSVAYG